nr:hypothetical protein [Verrucosispora sioxanthis]
MSTSDSQGSRRTRRPRRRSATTVRWPVVVVEVAMVRSTVA